MNLVVKKTKPISEVRHLLEAFTKGGDQQLFSLSRVLCTIVEGTLLLRTIAKVATR